MNYDLRVLNKAVVNRKNPSKFFTKTFFKPQMPEAVNIIEVDKTKLSSRKLAPIVSPVENGVVMDKQGYNTYTLTPAYIHPKKQLTVADLSKRSAGESPYSTVSAEQRQDKKIASYLVELDDAVERRIEYMAVEAILTGKSTVRNAGDNKQISYGRSSDNSMTLTSNKWGTNTADIAGNLRTARKTVLKNSGVNPDVLIMGDKALQAFLADTKIQALYSNAGYKMASLTGVPDIDDPMVTYYGTIPEFGKIYGYSESYYDEQSKTIKQLIPDNTVVYGSSAGDNRLYFGAINNLHAGGMVALEKFVDYQVQENGKGATISIESAPLPANTDPDSVYVLTVL